MRKIEYELTYDQIIEIQKLYNHNKLNEDNYKHNKYIYNYFCFSDNTY